MNNDDDDWWDWWRQPTYLGLVVRVGRTGSRHKHIRRIIRLIPNKRVNHMETLSVGHTLTDTIVYLDQNGQPMQTAPVPDKPPAWTNLAANTVDTMQVSADGTTDGLTAAGPGVDTVTVTVVVGEIRS
jgi:hypothetical protein